MSDNLEERTARLHAGIPWMEAILECKISGTSDSFWAEHWLDDLKDKMNGID